MEALSTIVLKIMKELLSGSAPPFHTYNFAEGYSCLHRRPCMPCNVGPACYNVFWGPRLLTTRGNDAKSALMCFASRP